MVKKNKALSENKKIYPLSFLSYSAQFSLGISHTGSGFRHALVSRNKKGHYSLISSGERIPFWIKLFSPLVINTDMGLWPTVVKTEHIGNQDSESWINKHEEFVIPEGMKSDQIASDYALKDQTICSASVPHKGIEQLISRFDSFIPKSISPPLEALVKLYIKNIGSDFILWKLTSKGSVFGIVQKGTLRKTYNSWITQKQIEKDDKSSVSHISEMLLSFSEVKNEVPLILFCPENSFRLPEKCAIPQFELRNPPEIRSVPEKDHEAYALALGTDGPDLTPFSEALKARKISSSKVKGWKITWSVTVLTIAALLILSSAKAGFHIHQSTNRYDRHKVMQQIQKLKEQKNLYDSLNGRFLKKTEVFRAKSKATNLLSELQTIFPKGVWAEEITLSENDLHRYSVKIRALTYSSSSITLFLANLNKTAGTDKVRIVYSENTSVKRKKAIRFLTECVWVDK